MVAFKAICEQITYELLKTESVTNCCPALSIAIASDASLPTSTLWPGGSNSKMRITNATLTCSQYAVLTLCVSVCLPVERALMMHTVRDNRLLLANTTVYGSQKVNGQSEKSIGLTYLE